MNRRGTRAKYRIHQRLKLSGTSIEVALKEICHAGEFPLSVTGVHLPIRLDGETYVYHPDRFFPVEYVSLEADGPYHDTEIQRRNAAQRDQLLWEVYHVRTLHIHHSLLIARGVDDSRKFWPYIVEEIRKFLASDLTSYRVPA